MGMWTGFIWLRIMSSRGLYDNEPSGSISGGEFLTQQSDHLLKKNSLPWRKLRQNVINFNQ
jgi:hypothetical protein